MDITDLVYIDSTGYHFADYPAFLTWLQDQYRAIYGADVYLEADSLDGQFLAILAKGYYDTAALGASVYNSFSPVTAQGVGLSRVVKINGVNRQIPTNSTVSLEIVGTAGTVITNGIAEDSLGQKWDLPATVTIGISGTETVVATAQELGAIAALEDTITTIFTPTLGWQTVNNPAAATEGAPVESDAELRVRQAQSVANPSLTVMDGTIGAVEAVEGVTVVRGYENDTDSTDGNGIPAHSIEVFAAGGDGTEIAQAIALHKTPGTGTAGTSNALVTDAHGMPLTIRYSRPVAAQILVEIEIDSFAGYSSDYTDLIKQSIADAINAIGIGNDVYLTKLLLSAYLAGAAGNTYDVVSFEISKSPDPVAPSNIDIDYNELPECDVSDITLTFA